MSQLGLRIFVSGTPDLWAGCYSARLYFKGTNLCHDAIIHRTAASSAVRSAATDELSLLKFYTLGDDDWKTLGSAADRKTGLALPATLCLTISGPCTGSW
jgi:hypothetical protein